MLFLLVRKVLINNHASSSQLLQRQLSAVRYPRVFHILQPLTSCRGGYPSFLTERGGGGRALYWIRNYLVLTPLYRYLLERSGSEPQEKRVTNVISFHEGLDDVDVRDVHECLNDWDFVNVRYARGVLYDYGEMSMIAFMALMTRMFIVLVMSASGVMTVISAMFLTMTSV